MSQQDSSYIADATNLVEVARLIRQDRLLTQSIGGLFPPSVDLSKISSVLDIACGPGGWVLDVAHVLPQTRVVGIDNSSVMVESAQRFAFAESTPNAHFFCMDARQPLVFPDASFDFVNARLIQSFMTPQLWKSFLAECWRVLSPGGMLCVTDLEFSCSTSAATDEVNALFYRSLSLTGRSFSPHGRSIGLAPMLRRLLLDAHFASITHQTYVLDTSPNAPSFSDWLENFSILYRSIRPFLLQAGSVSETELDHLYDLARMEQQENHYCNLTYMSSYCGRKPLLEGQSSLEKESGARLSLPLERRQDGG